MTRGKSRQNGYYRYEPDYAVPPGQTLQETIETLGMDQRELAKRTGLSVKHVNQIIKGAASITQDTAIRLERVTGVPARVWNNLEANFREQLARLAEKSQLHADLAWLKSVPTKELIKRGQIHSCSDPIALLEEVLCFFGVANVDAWKDGWEMPQFAFRKALAFQGKPGAMATWLRLCELETQKVHCHLFSKSHFRQALEAIRDLTVEAPEVFLPAMIERCAGAGVAVVISCGKLDQIMDDLLDDVRIDGLHSFEDTIKTVEDTKARYGHRIAVLGGIDVDFPLPQRRRGNPAARPKHTRSMPRRRRLLPGNRQQRDELHPFG